MVPVSFSGYEVSIGGFLHLQDQDGVMYITDDNDVHAMDMNNVFTQLFAYLAALLGFGIVSNVYIAGDTNDYQTFWADRSILDAKKQGISEGQAMIFSRLFIEQIR